MVDNETPFGHTPAQWKNTSLGEVVQCLKNGTTAKQNSSGVGLPVSRIETISAGKINFEKIRWTHLSAEDLKDFILQKDDVLFSHINSVAHIGKVARYDGSKKLYHGMNLMLIRYNPTSIDPIFGFYLLSSRNAKIYFETRCKKAINQASLNRGDIASLPIPLPPLPEQRKIAAILSSVDDAIEKSSAVIDQLEVVKKALMQELLTRGLPGRHTRFKQTEIGEIPAEWEVARLRDIAVITSGGTPARSNPEYWRGSIPWVKTGEIDYNLISETEECVTEAGIANSSAKIVPMGAILLAMYGQGTTRGKVALLGIDAAVNQACLAVIPKDMIQKEFLFYYFVSSYEMLRDLGNETSQKNLNASIVGELLIPIPNAAEQTKISKALGSLDNLLRNNKATTSTLSTIKSALLSSLLSGEVRVPLDKDAA